MFCSRNTWFIFILSIWLKHAQAILCYFASSAVPRFNLVWIMRVLTESLLPSPGNGDISVMVSPLHRKRAICWPLYLNLQMLFQSLIKRDMEALLDKFPEVGQFLEAMGSKKFDPKIQFWYQLDCWKQTGGSSGAEHLVFRYVQVSGLPIDADNGLHFVQIFGKLAALGEHWCVLDLFGILTLDWSGSSTVFSNTGWSWLAFQPWSRTKHPSYSPASSYPGDMNGVTCLSAASLVMTLWIPSG